MKEIIVAAAIVKKEDRILIAQRKGGSLDGKWEFPGGKVRKNETPQTALERELLEELGVKICVGDFIASGSTLTEDTEYIVRAYHVSIVYGCIKPNVHADIIWVSPDEINKYEMPEADREICNRNDFKIKILSFSQ